MASPVAVRQPLTTRTVNTAFFETKTPVVGQKRLHSQITGGSGQENVQTHIFSALKSPSRPTKRNLVSRPTVQIQPQFKQPLPRAETKPRQRQQTNDPAQAPEGESKAMQEWRRSMKVTFATSTFYFDGLEENFKDQATRCILRLGGKVEQFFSNAVTTVVTSREMPSSTRESPAAEEPPRPRTTSYRANLHLAGDQEPPAQPVKDILIRARDLGIKIWASEKFKRILRAFIPSTPPQSQPATINPLHLSAALKAEKRTGRTTETDPAVPREEYVYFEGPYILVSDKAQVHKPIMVREYPVGSTRAEALWPMFWSCTEGHCPFIRPRPEHKPAADAKHYARPNLKAGTPNPIALQENVQIQNRKDQPASGIINSSNQFSAIRSTTTCGVTSALSGLGGAIHVKGSLSREVRDLKNRLTPATIMPPPAKKRRTDTLREQLAAKTKPKEKREGYCENCKDHYDDYQEHTKTKRHRKYARNDKNFVDLDALLVQLKRPLLADEPDYIA